MRGTPSESSRRGGRKEYRHVDARVPSAMADQRLQNRIQRRHGHPERRDRRPRRGTHRYQMRGQRLTSDCISRVAKCARNEKVPAGARPPVHAVRPRARAPVGPCARLVFDTLSSGRGDRENAQGGQSESEGRSVGKKGVCGKRKLRLRERHSVRRRAPEMFKKCPCPKAACRSQRRHNNEYVR